MASAAASLAPAASWTAFRSTLTCVQHEEFNYTYPGGSTWHDGASLLYKSAEKATEPKSYAAVTFKEFRVIPESELKAAGDGVYFYELGMNRPGHFLENIIVSNVSKASLIVGTNDEFFLDYLPGTPSDFWFKGGIWLLFEVFYHQTKLKLYFAGPRETKHVQIQYTGVRLSEQALQTLTTTPAWITSTHEFRNRVAIPLPQPPRPVLEEEEDATMDSTSSDPNGELKTLLRTVLTKLDHLDAKVEGVKSKLFYLEAAVSGVDIKVQYEVLHPLQKVQVDMNYLKAKVDAVEKLLLEEDDGEEEDEEEEYEEEGEEEMEEDEEEEKVVELAEYISERNLQLCETERPLWMQNRVDGLSDHDGLAMSETITLSSDDIINALKKPPTEAEREERHFILSKCEQIGNGDHHLDLEIPFWSAAAFTGFELDFGQEHAAKHQHGICCCTCEPVGWLALNERDEVRMEKDVTILTAKHPRHHLTARIIVPRAAYGLRVSFTRVYLKTAFKEALLQHDISAGRVIYPRDEHTTAGRFKRRRQDLVQEDKRKEEVIDLGTYLGERCLKLGDQEAGSTQNMGVLNKVEKLRGYEGYSLHESITFSADDITRPLVLPPLKQGEWATIPFINFNSERLDNGNYVVQFDVPVKCSTAFNGFKVDFGEEHAQRHHDGTCCCTYGPVGRLVLLNEHQDEVLLEGLHMLTLKSPRHHLTIRLVVPNAAHGVRLEFRRVYLQHALNQTLWKRDISSGPLVFLKTRMLDGGRLKARVEKEEKEDEENLEGYLYEDRFRMPSPGVKSV